MDLHSPKTLSNKQNIDDKIDFLSSYCVIENKESIPVIDRVIISNDTLCRLDLIVAKHYGNTDELDLFLKYNNIDDMFAVPIGTVIEVPEKYALIQSAKYISTSTTCSLNANKTKHDNTTSETVVQGRSKLQNRGVGFTLLKPGVLKF